MKRYLAAVGVVILCTYFAKAGPLSLHYDKPAQKWVEALPIGNGSLGGMIFAGVEQERIQFNEESLITGDSVVVGSYQPFGNVNITFGHNSPSNYKRRLDLQSAVHSVNYTEKGVEYTRESFASYPDGVIVTRIKASAPRSINCTVSLDDEHGATTKAARNRLTFSGSLPENGMKYEAQLLIVPKGGRTRLSGGKIEVEAANEVLLILGAGTDFKLDRTSGFRTEAPHGKVTLAVNKAAKTGYDELLKRHKYDYQELFGRVELSLPESANQDRTTQELIDSYDKQKGNSYLETLLFQYGRYLMIGSSRPGSLPSNLQGVWNDQKKPAWYSQYTTDINIEMNYWLTETTSLQECHEPYFDWLENMAKVQAERGKRDSMLATKNGKGWINYSTNNIMGGASTWGVNHPGSAWMSSDFWEHYAFGGNRDFLLKRAYPMLKDLTEYWEGELIESPDGKHLITPGGWSPEHGPGMKEGDRTLYPGISYDIQIVYDLFTNYIDAAKALNTDSEYSAHIRKVRDRLLSPQIGKWGQLQEWMEDWDDPADRHRHFSHLFAVHPGRQISPSTTPELAQAAYVSLNSRGDISTGWSTAWKICVYARLCRAERAHDLIRSLFKECILANLFDTHPPFQIDGNFGYTAGVAEMLLQTHLKNDDRYVYHLLPALPSLWATQGSIKGLRGRGGCTVDQHWKDGSLVEATFTATQDVNIMIVYKNKSISKDIKQGETYKLTNI